MEEKHGGDCLRGAEKKKDVSKQVGAVGGLEEGWRRDECGETGEPRRLRKHKVSQP